MNNTNFNKNYVNHKFVIIVIFACWNLANLNIFTANSMNTEKSIKGSGNELTNQFTICFSIFLLINFIFQITLFHYLLLDVVLILIITSLINLLSIPIIFIAAHFLVLNKLVDDHCSKVKFPDVVKFKRLSAYTSDNTFFYTFIR